ncbi:elongation factor G [Lactiplantibacillus mudanjiangensis]|uniref:Elongation factor G [Lactobacillus koreensis] n=1 Tax=Lactiplantibacillus mudanjiangensis TaxID=1296538 RepID=A0A660DYT6_9LACO|nr:TetM/TetW/TetO/TetS family tetracycline resistance ribosomal protection protein [Lactiplantibacillus mudanjiangensis]VDG20959.1 elongation factor G [Lactobacillus koreensis] [Lactiplantibacillus mudanjiangensis]VDG22742.1 elongation factor G [Lactobacillus koreensis] [Lactiplantibacillus mudanjiangensis]VDG26691.1 elongation factor G [Lactobacillus koreensis] [Lactiplantibacillus mudanjiangensis]VDG31920.1 elongation factor G [Lactobacillus koreensis] [Lactiplantibacillus mudanjiangensis]
MSAITAGIVAHVDAGKTTLSEALLYRAGTLRQLGRVDKGDAFLDPDDLEKQRGITIFSHQAHLKLENLDLTLLDTPGHVDFAAQTEQVLSVLDYAILVVSATDGVQGYTRTLWRLLAHYQVPTFIFVNKMDVNGVDQAKVLTQFQTELSPGCIAFTAPLTESAMEAIAMQDDDVLAQYLENESLDETTIANLIQQRAVFPCYFGSALKIDGIDDLLAGLQQWTQTPAPTDDFGAKVFKISYDAGERLTWLRLTGGTLAAKAELLPEQKINQIRVYNGAKYTIQPTLTAGEVGAIPNLTGTYPGQGLGVVPDDGQPLMQPVLNYTVDPKANDVHDCLTIFRQLADEDPQLHVVWSEELQEIRLQVMGSVQLEILQQRLQDQFHLDVGFGEGSILYQETITQAVEGVGHFEPLRHYAEVHVLLQPTAPGSGLTFAADCNLDVLGRNWQHQVLSNLQAKVQRGVLVGAPLTDVRLTLVGGRASNVHSVGGDFREATWRAVRQGLMMLREQQKCQLLEPWYRFRLVVGQDQVGRAMTDIQRMSGEFEAPETNAMTGMTVLTGTAPVAEMQDYSQAVNAYTHGQGELECLIDGYRPCHNAETVITATDYQPVSDLPNTPDSVFCAHGAGYPVPWDQVPQMAHCDYRYTAAELAALTAD